MKQKTTAPKVLTALINVLLFCTACISALIAFCPRYSNFFSRIWALSVTAGVGIVCLVLWLFARSRFDTTLKRYLNRELSGPWLSLTHSLLVGGLILTICFGSWGYSVPYTDGSWTFRGYIWTEETHSYTALFSGNNQMLEADTFYQVESGSIARLRISDQTSGLQFPTEKNDLNGKIVAFYLPLECYSECDMTVVCQQLVVGFGLPEIIIFGVLVGSLIVVAAIRCILSYRRTSALKSSEKPLA